MLQRWCFWFVRCTWSNVFHTWYVVYFLPNNWGPDSLFSLRGQQKFLTSCIILNFSQTFSSTSLEMSVIETRTSFGLNLWLVASNQQTTQVNKQGKILWKLSIQVNEMRKMGQWYKIQYINYAIYSINATKLINTRN